MTNEKPVNHFLPVILCTQYFIDETVGIAEVQCEKIVD